MDTPSQSTHSSPVEASYEASGRKLGIAPETRQLSFIHWAVDYDGLNWGRNLAAYLAVVAFTYGLMSLVAVTQFPPGARPSHWVFGDWAVMFAFGISFPAILFMIASDQQALNDAMNGVWKSGVVTESRETVEEFRKKWAGHFKIINLAVQTAGLLLAIVLSYFTAHSFDVAGTKTWIQAGTPTGYAYMAGIALFYALLITYIVRCVALAVLLKNMAANWQIELSTMHPDGCGGLQPLGRIGLRNQYALTILGINIAVVAATIYQINQALVVVIIVPALAVYLIFGPIIFLGPLLPFRRVMADKRRRMMQEIAAPLDAKFDKLREHARVNGAVDKDELEELERLRSIGTTVGGMPIWPFDAPTMRVFATAYVIPLLLAVATKGVELIIQQIAK